MIYRPSFYNSANEEKNVALKGLIQDKHVKVIDRIAEQLMDLMLCRNAGLDRNQVQEQKLVDQFLNQQGSSLDKYGNWVYYPRKNEIVRVLPEKEFIEVRTNRNKYKITPQEQDILGEKVIGIAGLSVGRAVATTVALERIAGEIRLADFDEIELSNLNRIKTPLSEMGINKAVSTAREIAEMDPYINVKCYTDGLTEANMDSFFRGEIKLDLFVEECDDIGIKIKSRLKCKELNIPVIMETNDNCIIDIERFDTEPNRPMFHGKLTNDDIGLAINAKSMEEKMGILSKILDASSISQEIFYTLSELRKTARAWPQLASDVQYGAGVVANLARKILLGKNIVSGQSTHKIEL
jgi:hypothetical protein